jgi:diaminohydroxyphosphoribosylaminopyrimidine deaminase/5-amino-6-(5-phosphoribosylamino)uracil reductase
VTNDAGFMARALELGRTARRIAPPNPWVGCVVVRDGEIVGEGATKAPGLEHAEIVALTQAGHRAKGATLYCTLEPCAHHGRTEPCAEAVFAAGVDRVVIGVLDPDERVDGRGVDALRDRQVVVDVGVLAEEISTDLAPYLWHRAEGRPYVVLKVASTLDGAAAMPDGSSRWITSEAARADVHEIRADSQAVLVGAGTVRADDPSLTARLPGGTVEPLRVVLGRAPEGAKVRPCLEVEGELGPILDDLGRQGVLQLLVEGGPHVFGEFLEGGHVNKVVWYVAPAWAGDGARGAVAGLTTPTIVALRRGRVRDVRQIGEDVRVEVDIS